jgi:hypothetical protein
MLVWRTKNEQSESKYLNSEINFIEVWNRPLDTNHEQPSLHGVLEYIRYLGQKEN